MDTSQIERVEQRPQEDPRLGRQLLHDRRSRSFAAPREVDGQRVYVRHRFYNPYPTPDQHVGCCTGVAKAILGNQVGNRVGGVVLGYPVALDIYRGATRRDPWEGSWEPTDTGSSGLAAGMHAIQMGLMERIEHCFGIEHVLDTLQRRAVSVGTWWHQDMFNPHPDTLLVTPTGGYAGGHQWVLVAHDPGKGWVEGLCWWNGWGRRGRFRLKEHHLASLLEDDGDAMVAYRKKP
jgi:hypothetical protein